MACILPGLRDKQLKKGWRGEVYKFDGGKYVLAYVYGVTLDEMRKRKHIIYHALKERAKSDE